MIDRLRLLPLALCAAVLLGACGGGGDDDGGGEAPAAGADAGGEGGSGSGVGVGTGDGDADGTGGGEGGGDVVAAPGGDTANGPDDALALDAPRRWTLGPASFEVNGDAATAQRSEGEIVVVVGTTGFDDSNGPYSGSAVSLTLSAQGAGLYPVSDVDTVVRAAADGTPAATLNVIAGTLQVDPLASTRWTAEGSTGQLSVVIDDEGRYHVSTVEPLTLSRELDLGSGIPDSPDQIDFAATNLHARPLVITAP